MTHFAEWVAGLGPEIANHLWQSTACAAAAWLVTLALKRNQARVRYAVWLAASIKFLIPFSLLIAAGNLLPHPRQTVAPVVYSAMDVVEEPFSDVVPQFAAPVIHIPTLRERVVAALPLGFAILWAMGAGVVVFRWGRSWRAVGRTLREAVVVFEGREWEMLRRVEGATVPGAEAPSDFRPGMPGLKSRPISETKANAGGPRLRRFAAALGMTAASSGLRCEDCDAGGIELRLSPERMEPGIFGVWRPVLVWPQELSARLDDPHIEAIVAHELAHVRRRDNLWAALHMLVETVFWFHPLVWWMERRMVAEREQACDEAVVHRDIAVSDRATYAEIYAEALLKTCRFCIESPLVCVAGVTGADLKQRVVEIVTGRALVRMSWAKKALISAAAVCVIAAPVVLGQAKAAQRLMMAAIGAAPKPVQAAAKAMMGEESASSSDAAEAAQSTSAASGSADTEAALGPAFEVATIRPADRNEGRRSFGSTVDASGRFTGSAVTLSSLVRFAYATDPLKSRISGGPTWADSDFFDVNAKIDGAYLDGWDKLTYEQRVALLKPMIRTLLVQRFRLKLHTEMLPTPVYALVQAKGGTKMKEVPAPDAADGDPSTMLRWMKENPGKGRPASVFCTGNTCTGTAVRMIGAIGQIGGSAHADRIVIDETGLKGYYDFVMPMPAHDDEDAMVEISEALGLKFEPRTMPVKTYVIDSAERPSVDGAEVDSSGESQLSVTYRKWLDEDAHWLMTPQERTDFLKLATDKERGAFIDAFWEKRNAPGAAKGAYKTEVYARITYANDHFSPGTTKPGWATDRGRAYIVYGKPDSIDVHPGESNAAYEVWFYNALAGVGKVTLRFDRNGNDYQINGAWPVAGATGIPQANGGSQAVAFDVASIRRDPATAGSYFRYFPGGRLSVMSWIKQVIQVAYGLKDYQVTGGPGWLTTDRYDIEAKSPNPDATKDDINAMTQALLTDRFKLRYHMVTKEVDVYDLVVDSNGPKLTPLKEGEDFHCTRDNTEICALGDPARLADWLKHFAGRPVLDKTGITGRYDILLTFDVYSAQGATPPEGYDKPSLMTALHDQLGLKLVPRKETMPMLVVDSIERPTEN